MESAPKPQPDMRVYYAQRAPYYDDVYLRPERQADIQWMRERLRAQLSGRTVLEVACGTGFWTQAVAPVAARLVATDATPQVLAQARQRPDAQRVVFAQADAYALPAALGRFDAAFAGLWLSHVPVQRRAAFFDSLHARLEPGARVLLYDNSAVQCRDFPVAERDAEGNTWQHRVLRDGTTHRVLKNFPDAYTLEGLVAGRGRAPRYRLLDNFWWFEYEAA